MEKPKVGQILYSLNVGNMARNCEQKLTKVIVKSVGRKYFMCSPEEEKLSWRETQYHISDWREKTEWCCNSCLYANVQEWEDEKESNIICKKIWRCFEYGHNRKNLSIEALRKIDSIIENKE